MTNIISLEEHRKKTTSIRATCQTTAEARPIAHEQLLLPDVSIESLKALLKEMNDARDRGLEPNR